MVGERVVGSRILAGEDIRCSPAAVDFAVVLASRGARGREVSFIRVVAALGSVLLLRWRTTLISSVMARVS